MNGQALLILAYATLAVFVIVAAYRTWKTARMPVHLRWELAPVPREKGKSAYGGSYFEEFEWWKKKREVSRAGELFYMLREILFLKGVWERNRRLWLFSFPLHAGIYLLLLMVCVLGADLALVPRRAVDEALQAAAFALAAAGYAIGVFGAAGLFVKRLVDPSLEPFTTPAARFNLLFLLAMFASGGAACFMAGDYPGGMQAFLLGIATARRRVLPPPGALAAYRDSGALCSVSPLHLHGALHSEVFHLPCGAVERRADERRHGEEDDGPARAEALLVGAAHTGRRGQNLGPGGQRGNRK